jgi:HlyD family secretion protein
MTASADIQTSTHINVLSVPLNAVTTRDKKSDAAPSKKDDASSSSNQPAQQANISSDDDVQEVVYLLQPDGTVKKYPVTTDIQDINYIQIKSGIKEGDMVITGPYDVVSKQLKDNMKVKVVSKDELMNSSKKP